VNVRDISVGVVSSRRSTTRTLALRTGATCAARAQVQLDAPLARPSARDVLEGHRIGAHAENAVHPRQEALVAGSQDAERVFARRQRERAAAPEIDAEQQRVAGPEHAPDAA
jgi:hypothetical protein